MSYRQQRIVITLSFLVAPILLLLMFTYYPAMRLFELSFSNWDGMSREYRYIGFENYVALIKDKDVLLTFSNNIAYLIIGIIQCFIGLYLAIILNGRIFANNFFKASIFLPYILNGVAIAFMFSFMYDFDRGLINVLITRAGFENHVVKWLSDNYMTNFSLAVIGLWRYTGLMMVMFLSALQSIPNEIYEAAELDGAKYIHKILYIIIPSIKSIIELVLFISINGALQAYFEPFVITKGGPAGRTATFVTRTVEIAFQFNDFGKASAMGVLLLFLVVIVIGIQRKIVNGTGE